MGQASRDRSACIDSLVRSAGTVQPGQDSLDSAVRTGQPGESSLDSSAWTGRVGQNDQNYIDYKNVGSKIGTFNLY